MSTWSERPGVIAASEVTAIRSAAWALEALDTPPAVEPLPGPAVAAEPVKSEAEWEREIEEAYARGVADGWARGEREGSQREAERLGTPRQALEAAAAAVREREAPWLEALEDNLRILAVAIARQIVGREVRADAAVIAELIRRALAEFPLDQPLRVRLNPHDLSLISALQAGNAEPVPIAPGRNLRWLADPRIEAGGCIVEGRERIVDGRVDRTLERVYWKLKDA